MARPNLRPRPKRSKAPFPFLALPTELRLQIYNYLLLSMDTSVYFVPSRPLSQCLRPCRCQHDLRRHGMLFANRQLHAEYAQAFYEYTEFVFSVNSDNGTQPATTPLWTLPPALLPSLRRCSLKIDVFGLSLAWGFSMEALATRIEATLGCMERVRWVQLRWSIEGNAYEEEWEKQPWWERSVQRLKEGAAMRGRTITIITCIWNWERTETGWQTKKFLMMEEGSFRALT